MNFATPLSNKRENNWVNCWELYVRPVPNTRYESTNMTISSQSIAIKANMAIAGSTTSGLPHVKTQVSPNAQPPSKLKLAFKRWGEDMVSSSVKALAAQKKILSFFGRAMGRNDSHRKMNENSGRSTNGFGSLGRRTQVIGY